MKRPILAAYLFATALIAGGVELSSKVEYRDVNGDGLADKVITYDGHSDVYLARKDGNKIVYELSSIQ